MSLRKRTGNTRSTGNYIGDDPLDYEKDPKSLPTLRILYCVAIIGIVLLIVYLKGQKDTPFTEEVPPPIVDQQYDPESLMDWEPRAVVVGDGQKPGEMGKPVEISDTAKVKELFKEHEFNILASDMISLNRSLLDTRDPKCVLKSYQRKLPTASIIIVFHNEAWSTLLRTVWSMINRSPRSLLREIFLVDDASDKEYLGEKLDEYVAKLPVSTTVIRTGNRTGLIRARLVGAERATSQVIVFMDAHCECNQGWLEPLLSRVAANRQTVASPQIDIISDETFEYRTTSGKHWGGFGWRVTFQWDLIPDREQSRRNHDPTEPIHTPAIAGGLFAIDREFFFELGSYDEGMEIWGAENLEMSFRVWTCGGVLELVPCSRVGHVFRKKTPYSFVKSSSAIIRHNTARLVDVWMDEWKKFYFSSIGEVVDYGDVSARHALRRRLKCRSFRWYLENIYQECRLPLEYNYLGYIENESSGLCLDTLGNTDGKRAGVHKCHGSGGNQIFAYLKSKRIVNNDNALDVDPATGQVSLVKYKDKKGYQEWLYNEDGSTIKNVKSGKCLTVVQEEGGDRSLLVRPCDGSMGQKWEMSDPWQWN